MARRLARAALIVLVCLVSFEGATRINQWVRFGTPPWSPFAVEEDLLTRDSLGEHGKPHAQFEKWTLNNVGMRGPDIPVTKPADVYRVVTAGASETFGLYESPDREYPRQLEDSLRAALSAGHCDGVNVEVLNAAIFGMTLPSIDQDLRTRVAKLRPDVVVLYPTPVQYLADSIPRAAQPIDPPPGDGEPWYAVLRPRAFGALREQLKAVLPGWLKSWLRERDIHAMVAARPPGWRFTAVPKDRLMAYDRDLRHAIGTIHGIGAAAVIMTHADVFMSAGHADVPQLSPQLIAWERFYPRATGAVVTAFDSDAVAVTLRAAEDSGASEIDLAGVVQGTPAAEASRLFADYEHFTDAGSALVATLLRNGIVLFARRVVRCRGGRHFAVTRSLPPRGS